MPQINQLSTILPSTNPGWVVPPSVRAALMAAQDIQNKAGDTSAPVYSTGAGIAKVAGGALGGLMEGMQLRKEEALQAASRQGQGALLAEIMRQRGAMGAGPGQSSPQAAQNGNAGAAAPAAAGDHAAYIQQKAAELGIDPAIALKVAQSEGLGAGAGDGGSSYGDFQLHRGGIAPGGNAVAGLGDDFFAQTGKDPADPANWQAADDFALQHAAKSGWGAFHGAAKAGLGPMDGIGAALMAQGGGTTGPGSQSSDQGNTPFTPNTQRQDVQGRSPGGLQIGPDGTNTDGSSPLPPPGAQSQPDAAPPADALALAGPDPMASAPAQQAIDGAMGGASPSPLAAALMQSGSPMSSGRGVNDPNSPQAFNAAQAGAGGSSPLTAALMGAGSGPGPGAAPGPAPAGPAPASSPGPFSGIASALLGPDAAPPAPIAGPQSHDISALYARAAADPRTPPAFLAQIAGMMTPQYSTVKADNGDILQVDQFGHSRTIAQGGKFTATRGVGVYNERDGLNPAGQPAGANREMTPEEVQAAGYPVGTHVQIGPSGERSVVNPGATADAQNEYNKGLSAAYAKPQVALMEGVEGARERQRSFNEMSGAIQRLQQNGGTTGMGQDEIMHLQNAVNSGANLLGITQPFDLSDKEILSKLNKQVASSAAKSMSTRGATNFDFSSFQQANPGLEMSPAGNQRMLGIMSQIEQRNIGVGQAMRDAYGQALQNKTQMSPVQMDQIIKDYDAAHHISDPVTGQDLTTSPKLPDLQGGTGTPPVAPGAPAAGGPPASAPAPAQPQSAPPMQGAKQAPDGNWYVADPNRPGKYLMVKP